MKELNITLAVIKDAELFLYWAFMVHMAWYAFPRLCYEQLTYVVRCLTSLKAPVFAKKSIICTHKG